MVLIMALKYDTVYAIVTKNWQVQDQFSLFNAGLGGKDVGLTQGLKGDAHTLEFTTSGTKGTQTPRLLIRGSNDYADTEFYSGPKGAELLRFMIQGSTGNIFWSNGGALRNDQGGSIELGDRGIPYLDFSNDPTSDYDARLILLGDDKLAFVGSNLGIDNYNPTAKLDVNGEIATREGNSFTSNHSNFANVSLGWKGDQARIRVAGDGPGGLNGLSILDKGNYTLLKIDEERGVLNVSSDYGTICIGKC